MAQNHETDREQLKKIALGIAVTLTAVILMVNVARYEVNVMLEIATTEWQRSINQYIFGAFAFVTMIIIAVVSGLKDSGKQRWFWYGLPIAVILLVLEEFAGYHYFTRLGYDYSEKQKSISLSKKTLESVFEKLDVKNAVIISESNGDQTEQILTLNNQVAFAEKRLVGCNKVDGWKKRTDCQHTYESALNTANRKLKAIADIQNEIHQSHSEKMSELNALLKLRETAQQEDKRVIPLPVYSMVISNNQTALAFQNGMNWFLATAIVVINSGLFFLGMGLLSQTKLSRLKRPSPALPENTEQSNADQATNRRSIRRNSRLGSGTRLFYGIRERSQANINANANAVHPNSFANTTNANAAGQNYGHSDLEEYDDEVPTPTPLNTTSPMILSGAGFASRLIPNPNFVRPTHAHVIHEREESPRGVEIDFPESDIPSNDPTLPDPALPEPTQLSTPLPQTGIGGDRGRDSDLAYLAIKEVILNGIYFKHFKFVSVGSLRDAPKVIFGRDTGYGAVVATRYRDYAIADGLPMSRVEYEERVGNNADVVE